MAQQCLKALHFLHDDMNLTHTDLKLENVMLAWGLAGFDAASKKI